MERRKPSSSRLLLAAGLIAALSNVSGGAQTLTREPKGATKVTTDANAATVPASMFDDREDFANANKGALKLQTGLVIGSAWDMRDYEKFIVTTPGATAPETINPSLYRNAQLNMIYGLFEVTNPDDPNERHEIYQVRGYDLSNITFVKGDTGWIVFDPLISNETAAAALALINQELGARPVTGVVYSHSHVDHFGGVKGLGTAAQLASIPIIAPEGFTEHAVSENVIAGNAMSRRAIYMYGSLLPKTEKGGVNGGLGQTNSTGEGSLIVPTDYITATGSKVRTVDGIKMEFQLTPGTEAPAEMNTYFEELKALWMAENTTNTMHNVLTLRGAQVRDPLKWSSFLDVTIKEYGNRTDVKFQSHHWPVWKNPTGPNNIVDYLKKQRDMYKFIHDQSVNLMNKGYTGEEISERIKLPDSLERYWPDRGYYGTLRHNSRAVYQRYMGWYNGNPSSLNNLPPEDVARHYVAYMGGDKDAILARAQAEYNATDATVETYRWLAELLKHLVFAYPDFENARLLLADVLEQLGYQSESGPWRNEYLVGASELRSTTGFPPGGLNTVNADTLKAMSPDLTFDYLAVRLDAGKANKQVVPVNVHLTELGLAGWPAEQTFGLTVENSVLNYGDPIAGTSTVQMSKATLDAITAGALTLDQAIANGDVKATSGTLAEFKTFWGMIETFPFWFNIVTP
ncbi:alkyl/aryl-sulfatase [Methylocella sp.]|uniref:alkyl/aryl-sulfatase n=1 Tax=Methylocella sp. TaxID=1978226 RepID=UPI003784D47E